MLNFIYSRLAVSSMRRSSRMYIPYLGAGMGMAAMFYIMMFLRNNTGLAVMRGGGEVQLMLTLGAMVVGFFAVIFLFYTHNFLIRQRKRELGLYNVLGMEKRHIARILAWETVFSAAISIGLGLGAGILTSKLMLLLLYRILRFPVPIGFEVSEAAVLTTVKLFTVIYAASLANAIRQVRLVEPLELLRAARMGEREPKTRWALALLGLASLGVGYAMALTIEHPLDALVYFFVAVIFVIIGTYLLFVAGSIAFLKLLRRNKRLYYRPRPFIAISGMIYRMKQHAVGLASICILSTMVLVTLSTTVSLYVGLEDVLHIRYPRENTIIMEGYDSGDIRWVRSQVAAVLERRGLSAQAEAEYRFLSFPAFQSGNRFLTGREVTQGLSGTSISLHITSLEDYNRLVPEPVFLAADEALVYTNRGTYQYPSIQLLGREFTVKGTLPEMPARGLATTEVFASCYLVVRDMGVVEEIRQAFVNQGNRAPQMRYQLGFDLNVPQEQAIAAFRDIKQVLSQNKDTFTSVQSREEARADFLSLYGGLFFLGLFLGLVFWLGTVLIIYYKQVTEGYEDRQRYVIMQQVGLSKAEVKSAINSQVLAVFFLPLVAAAAHVAASFKMATRLLTVLNLTNVALFASCTAGVFAGFAVLYTLVYRATARVYYRIVAAANGA